jgi:hypothetical protein
MIYKWQQSKNQKLVYNYQPINSYFRESHIYGAASPVLHLLENKVDVYKHMYNPEDYYSAFAFTKTIDAKVI